MFLCIGAIIVVCVSPPTEVSNLVKKRNYIFIADFLLNLFLFCIIPYLSEVYPIILYEM